MAVAVRTAGVVVINWGTVSDPAAQNITTVSGDKGVAVSTTAYTTAGFTVSYTLNGLAPDHTYSFPGTFDEVGHFINVWLNPAIGTLALDPVFDSVITDGPTCIVCPLTSTNDISVVGGDADSFIGDGVATATAASGTGDLALAFAQNYGSVPTIGGAGAANVTNANQNQNGERTQGFTVTAGALTSTATSTGDTYPTVALVVLRDGGAAPVVAATIPALAFAHNF